MISSRRCLAIVVAALMISTPGDIRSDEVGSPWFTDFEKAHQRAQELQCPLLIHFFAHWCAPCQMMERQVLHHPEVTTNLGKRIVAVKVLQPQNPELSRKFGIQALPTDIVIDPSGKVVWRNESFVNRSRYVQLLARVMQEYQPRERLGETTHPDTPTAPAQRIGIDGYCPVALVKNREWVKGKKNLISRYKGVTYYLADEGSFAAFEGEPGRFAPRLLGCDPVILNDTHRALPGSAQYGAFFDGALFFFRTAENRIRFKVDPVRYTQVRHALKVEDIEDSRIQ